MINQQKITNGKSCGQKIACDVSEEKLMSQQKNASDEPIEKCA